MEWQNVFIETAEKCFTRGEVGTKREGVWSGPPAALLEPVSLIRLDEGVISPLLGPCLESERRPESIEGAAGCEVYIAGHSTAQAGFYVCTVCTVGWYPRNSIKQGPNLF